MMIVWWTSRPAPAHLATRPGEDLGGSRLGAGIPPEPDGSSDDRRPTTSGAGDGADDGPLVPRPDG
ncbi:hypothetical protein ABZV14_10805 [Streptosporangium canum]|uniref:hypothetical protein n=1 Tax=Streptosporangium canum TaxID=324952 RepID=UPI0033BBACB5